MQEGAALTDFERMMSNRHRPAGFYTSLTPMERDGDNDIRKV